MDRRHLEHGLRRHHADVHARVLVEQRDEMHQPQHVEMIRAVAAVAPEGDRHAAREHLGEAAVLSQPLRVLQRGRRAVRDLHAVAHEQRDVVVAHVHHVGELRACIEHTQRGERRDVHRVVRRARRMRRAMHHPPPGAVFFREGMGAADQRRGAGAEPEQQRPRRETPVRAPLQPRDHLVVAP